MDKKPFKTIRGVALLLALQIGLSSTAHAVLNIPNVPMQSGVVVPPNIWFILDDSGSMTSDYMPDGLSYDEFYRRTFVHNTIYYNPLKTYLPWQKADQSYWPDASPTAAYTDANLASGSTTDLRYGSTVRYFIFPKSLPVSNPADKTLFYRFVLRGSDIRRCEWSTTSTNWDANCTDLTSVTWTSGGTSITRSLDQEWQNFANWFVYHRTRMKVAKAGAGSAFAGIGAGYRVGFTTIWNRNTFEIPVGTNDGAFDGANRSTWYSRLYDATGSGMTPLIPALQRAGEYFKNSSSTGPWGPGTSQLACRKNFSILTTDGYWNSTSGYTSVGNSDGTDGSVITGPGGKSYQYVAGPPYKDGYSDTLADVAMHYWKNDLRTDLGNVVGTTSANPAFWQHMVTYGISIGLKGNLDPITDMPGLIAGTTAWPNPLDKEDKDRIDDLLHASVNGRGKFISAGDPTEFANGLRDALTAISDEANSASNVAANSTYLDVGSAVFSATYFPGDWSGELERFEVSGQGLGSTATWKASSKLPAHGSRKIFTRNESNKGVEFLWSNLGSSQQAALGSQDVLNYLRGDQSKEQSQSASGVFRNRSRVLGDIIHSSPAYNPDSKTVFVGANDGMLHAFDASSGVEQFAYVPSAVLPNLKSLSDPAYAHRYFVDGEVIVTRKSQTAGKNFLVGAFGRGAKGLYGLNVTNPASFSTGDILYEVGVSGDADMGFVTGTPVLAQVNNGDWAVIVGNGYNSSNERAVLFVIRVSDGAVLARIDTKAGSSVNPNGLASPAVYDEDQDGKIDYVYAGDLLGNFWKFDLTGSNTNGWKSAYGTTASPQPMFVAKNAAGKAQPITGQPAVLLNQVKDHPTKGKLYVFFGTGRYLTGTDPADTSIQSWYGLIDEDAVISGRSELKERSIEQVGAVSTSVVRTFSKATKGDMSSVKGWYIDFVQPPSGTATGERIVSASSIVLTGYPVLVASSIIPDQDKCSAGGSGFINAVDPFTGGRLTFDFFDANNDGVLDAADRLSGDITSSWRPNTAAGLPSQTVVIGNRLVGKFGAKPEDTVIPMKGAGRISWREVIPE